MSAASIFTDEDVYAAVAPALRKAGIIVSIQRPIGDTVRRLLHLAGKLDAETLQDRLEYLGDW